MTAKKDQLPKPRAIRNTAKQSIIILGHPDFLYKDKEIKETFITINGEKRSIGRLGDDVHLALEDLAKGKNTKITRVTKTIKSPVSSIEGFTSVSIQKRKGDTLIVIPAADETALIEKVYKLKGLLESNGAITQERCNWMCIADKGKVQVSNEEILKKEKLAKIQLLEKEVNNNPYSDNPPQTYIKKEMSDHTKRLHGIAQKAIKEAKL